MSHGSLPDAAVAALRDIVASGKAPGVAYAAVTADGVIGECAAGHADLAADRAMTPATTLMAYSMTKPITAAAVLQLVERGAVDVDAPVASYVPESPYGPAVTIRQLLAHTGGLPNPIPLRWVHPAAGHAGFDEASALHAVLRAHPRLAGAPGARYRYSNIGYWLLGRVVERVSRLPFSEFAAAHIFAPIDARDDELSFTTPDPANHAAGYLEKFSLMNVFKPLLIDRALIGNYEGPWLRIEPHYPNGPAFGGAVGSVRGFARFLVDCVRDGSRLLQPRGRSLFYEQQTTTGKRPVPMTLGWHVGAVAGRRMYFKEGGGGGFHCMMRLYPGQRAGTVIMANATGVNASAALTAVDAALWRG